MKSRLLFASFAMLGLTMFQSASGAELGVGDKAPAFELTGSDGKTYTSEQFEGEQVVVIAWYPKAFTGG